jgi:NADH dehydrogenase (ubiquinone) 1 beta subcomplex subunit 3
MANLPLFRDSWAKREAWRKHPVFSNRSMFRNMFPGFGIAVVAFTAYVMMDDVWQAIKKREGTKHH